MGLSYRDYPILYVDDELANRDLMAFVLGQRFDLRCVESGARALAMLEQEPIAVLLTDQRMPGMSGVELCERARALRPETVRVIVTAYADHEAVIDAVNRGRISAYIAKPWHPDELAERVRQVVELAHSQHRVRELELRLHGFGGSRAAALTASYVVHELASPCAALAMNAQSLRALLSRLEPGAPVAPELLGQIRGVEEGLTTASTFVRKVIDSFREPGRDDPCDALEVTRDVLVALGPALRRVGSVEETLEPSGRVAISEPLLAQVLFNLLTNARQSIEAGSGGRIEVGLRVDGPAVLITVADDGPGIPEVDVERIWEPNYTTKREGSGLGLGIVRHIVRRVGGDIDLARAGGPGAEFRVRLPRARPELGIDRS